MINADTAVSIQNVAKKYRLFSTPVERLKESLHPFRKRYHKEFWALRCISFDIRRGEFVGIMGRNGSGKSTLLQIIASVLRPTSGTITVNGRVSALLELGAGFNPEFTGRQNVLLNGAIMGVSHAEMLHRIPEIMAFADIGEFFDQPMKIYSSGMFVRVAFAASVHIDPDILIIDEALAVGDAKFQHKCFQRLADLREQNKTVILVTHNSSLVTSYCDRAFLLEKGELLASGNPSWVVDRYYDLLFDDAITGTPVSAERLDEPKLSAPGANHELEDIFNQAVADDLCHTRQSYNSNEVRFGNGAARIVDYLIESQGHRDAAIIQFGAKVHLYIKVLFCQNIEMPVVGFTFKTVEGVDIFGTNTFLMRRKLNAVTPGQICVYKFSFSVPVKPSDYFLDIGIAQADGTRGGGVLEVRRSIAHCIVSLDKDRYFDGLIDLAPEFEAFVERATCAQEQAQ